MPSPKNSNNNNKIHRHAHTHSYQVATKRNKSLSPTAHVCIIFIIQAIHYDLNQLNEHIRIENISISEFTPYNRLLSDKKFLTTSNSFKFNAISHSFLPKSKVSTHISSGLNSTFKLFNIFKREL